MAVNTSGLNSTRNTSNLQTGDLPRPPRPAQAWMAHCSITRVAKRTLLAGQAGSSGPVGDRYVKLDIARSIESYVPQCGPATYSYSSPRSGYRDRKSTRLNSSHANISYAVFCLKKKAQ